LLRDGSRLLGLAVPLVVVLVAVAVDGLLARLDDRAARAMVVGVLALVPVSLMPDVAWGMGGALRAVDYPVSYADARRAVAGAPAGDALSLPFVAYRAPVWNHGHPVLDPLPRYLGRTTVVNDVLVVSGREVAGEDPRAAEVGRGLDTATPRERSAALREAGVAVAVAEDIEGYPSPELAGRTVLRGDLTVIELGEAESPAPLGARSAVMAAAWAAWLLALLAPVPALLRAARRRAAPRSLPAPD
jgi:hypothetical protein